MICYGDAIYVNSDALIGCYDNCKCVVAKLINLIYHKNCRGIQGERGTIRSFWRHKHLVYC